MLRAPKLFCALGLLTTFLLSQSNAVVAGPSSSEPSSSTSSYLNMLYDYEVYYEQVTEKYNVLMWDDTYSTTYEFNTLEDANAFAEYASSYLGYEVWIFPSYETEWILFGTYDTSLSANAVETWLSGWGLNTKIEMVSVFSSLTTSSR